MKTTITLMMVCSLGIIMMISSCTPEEKIINPAQDTWSLLTVTKSNPNYLQVSTISNGNADNPKIQYNRGIEISNIVEYRNYLFLMLPSIYKVIIVDRGTYQPIDSIDFSVSKRIPSAIGFGNATTAYIAHENDSVVTVYDLYNFKIATEIKVGYGGIAIKAGIGDRQNQIFVANNKSNSVSQIDTRTNTVVKTYYVNTSPRFLDADLTGAKILVACDGRKGVDSSVYTAPSVAFIDIDRKLILDETSLNTGKSDALQATIKSMCITKSEWAFLALSNGLFRLDTRKHKALSAISSEHYTGLTFNARRNELLMILDSYIYIADENTGDIKSSPIVFPNAIQFAIGQ